jgi:hypothetical protein
MKIRIILKIVVLVCASSSLAFAQATSPAQVDLSYHFKPGTTLHYQRLDEIRNPDNPPGYMEGNFDTKDDIHITVEKVDSLGNATLVIQNEETHDFKDGDDANGVTMGGLAQNIPLYRVTVNRYGNYLSGNILHRSPQDSLSEVRTKDPKIWTSPRSDSATIKFWMKQALYPKPERTHTHVGMKWADSSTRISHPIHIALNNAPSPASASPPDDTPIISQGYNAYHYDYTLDQDAADRNAGQYQLATKTVNYQVAEGTLISQGITDETEKIRTSDGLTFLSTQLAKRVPGKSADTTFDRIYMRRTLTLISIDSTAH